jgi:CO/xanthine dehydrogenase Mo-binding subunit
MKFAVIARPPVAFRKQMERTAANPGKVVRNDGDAEGALKSAAKIVTAQYYIPHLAHASMEPPNALVNVSQGKAGTECVAFAPTQSPVAAAGSGQGTRDPGRERLRERSAAGWRIRS